MFPYEITFNILKYLDYYGVYNYCYCNKYLSEVVKDYSFWKHYINERNISKFPFNYNIDRFINSLIDNNIRLIPIYVDKVKMKSVWINKYMCISEVLPKCVKIIYGPKVKILNWKGQTFINTKYGYSDKHGWRGRSTRIIEGQNSLRNIGIPLYFLSNVKFDVLWDVCYEIHIKNKVQNSPN
ncbi:F-box domain-containing protein [Orpheovirus IHUMI-LCC2]|uniref:F-box domain-containing protein n=1 Tax=Orpheovirus IHUMI-LCC2 TaxID=2023057 RepID=A0A2I2L406_9VIRU|nr:F-box domain-containing protein [Orpheovirus IHUMI-LCC2]SNW62282.1 F-box domain-containing protein [Orpheovirus IHUMI-LCC2]